MPYFETHDGVPIYYEDQGEGETILLVHGWMMNAEYWWQKNFEVLADSHRVVALDLRGHGLSGKTDAGHTLAQYARDVRKLIETLELNDVTLVGWSMGTAVLFEYFDQFGSYRLSRAVFVDQSPKLQYDDDWPHGSPGKFSGIDGIDIATNLTYNRPSIAKSFIESMFNEPPAADTIDEMYAETTKTPTSVAIEIFLDVVYADFRPVLSTIDVPVLLLYGERNDIFPTDVGGWLEDHLSETTLVRFDQSGHCPFWEEPEKFNQTVASFAG